MAVDPVHSAGADLRGDRAGDLLPARSARPAARLHAGLLLLVPEAVTSLIIITLRRAALLRNTLQSLARQTRRPDEIVVVDNGPDAETRKVALDTGARYVVEPRRGYGCARNRGLAEARGEVLYF